MNWMLLLALAGVIIAIFALTQLSFVSAEAACRRLRQGALVVDVRSPGEFNDGHLPGAVNIPLSELSSEMPRRVSDKKQVLLLHCLSGTRSGIAKRQLKGLGYTNAFNLGSYSRAEKLLGKATKA